MLKTATMVTRVLMLIYWILAAGLMLNLIHIDSSLMYSDPENPLSVA